MTDIYKTIAQKSEGTYTEKRSKFLAFAHPVETLDQIKELIEGYKKKYYDARHVCYAYMLGADRATFRANDDGEPSSTAGKPILGQINSKELTNILVVVIRYFGGVKLGTSGLIIAYKEATIAALSNANVIEKQVEELISYTFPYVMMNSVMKVVKELNPQIVSQTYEQTCQITLSIRRSMAPILQERLNKLAF
jgi:xaa-pro dipeptidase